MHHYLSTKTLFPAFLVCLLLSGCFKIRDRPDENRLPPSTQEGKNTLGCLIDGKVWVPLKSGWFDRSVKAHYYKQHGYLGIYAQKEFEGYGNPQHLSIFQDNVLVPGVYAINPDSDTVWSDTLGVCSPVFYPGYKSLPGGKLTITKLDTIAQIISGTFEFDGYSNICQDTLHITEGRFDIKYSPN